MRLIRDNRLFESILDNIGSELTPSASSVLSNNINARADDCEVTVYFMLLLHSREQISRLPGLIERIADAFYDSVEGFRGVSEYYTDVLIPNPDFQENKTKYPHNLLKKETGDDVLVLSYPVNEQSDLSEMTTLMTQRITSIPKKGNIPIQFRLRMNLTERFSMRTCAVLVGQMFRTMYRMIMLAEYALRGSLSYMLKMGPSTYVVTTFRKDYDSSYRKCFMNLIEMVARLDIDMDEAERFIREFTSGKNQKELSKMTIPDKLQKIFTPHDLRYIASFQPKIEIDGSVVKMTVPKHINISITGIYYVWYYIEKKYNYANPDDKLTLETYVEGIMSVSNDIYESHNDWYECIKRVGTVVSRDTEFKKLNLYLMRAVDAETLILINPVLQRTKYDAQEQTCDIDLSRWKNPDIQIESPTHDIIIEDVPRLPGKQMIKAVKK